MIERIMRASDVSGLPVVTIDGGDDLAEVKDVVFDGTSHRLIGFTLNKRGWFRGALRQHLPTQSIAAIGPDAVMVGGEADLTDPEDVAPALTGDAETHDVLANRVLSDAGRELGAISGVIISTGEEPLAVGYELTSPDGDVSFIPISAQMTLSDANLIVPDAATAFIRNDLAGFGAAVQSHRQSLDTTTEAHS